MNCWPCALIVVGMFSPFVLSSRLGTDSLAQQEISVHPTPELSPAYVLSGPGNRGLRRCPTRVFGEQRNGESVFWALKATCRSVAPQHPVPNTPVSRLESCGIIGSGSLRHGGHLDATDWVCLVGRSEPSRRPIS